MLKFGICLECKTYDFNRTSEVPIIAGRCQYHYRIFRKKVCLERNKNRTKVKELINPKVENDVKLSLWYRDRMKECTGICANCGEKISLYHRHSSIAHVLPKKKEFGGFLSVATHKLNWIELGPLCGCHNKFDVSWWSASKMKIFPQAIEIAIQLYPLLTFEEQGRFPEVFEKHLNKNAKS